MEYTLQDVISLLVNRLDGYFGAVRNTNRERQEVVIRCLTGITVGTDPNYTYNAQTELHYHLTVLLDGGGVNQKFERFETVGRTPNEVEFRYLLPVIRSRAAVLSQMAGAVIGCRRGR